MDPSLLFMDGLWVAMKISAPVLIGVTVVGLLVAVLQALTQIQEQTLQFTLKLAVCMLVVLATGRWAGIEIARLAINAFDIARIAGR